jgi:hypothetical protein
MNWEEKNRRKSMIWTAGIHLGMILLFLFLGLKYIEPKPEDGIVINFGYDVTGSGTEAVEQPTEQQNQTQETQTSQPQETSSEEQVDEVLTQDSEDAPTVTQENNSSQQESQEQVEEEPQPDEELDNSLSDFFSNPNSSEGETGNSGDQGDPTGDPDAPDHYGNQGSGGDGDYQLGGRAPLSKPKPTYDCDEEGKVVVKIWVDRSGSVVRAQAGERGSTTTAPCLLRRAEEAAKKTKFQGDSEAPERQIGTIIYRFYQK